MSENPQWMEKLESLAQEIAVREGCVLYDMDFSGTGKNRTLRIFIDKETGIGIDECSDVAKGINEVLDAQEDLVPGESYSLEVSSPGLDRHLKKPWHFEKVIGKKVFIKTSKSLESVGVTDKKWKSAKTVEEVLQSADAEGIRFVVKDVEFKIPYSLIEKAKLVFDLNKGQKK